MLANTGSKTPPAALLLHEQVAARVAHLVETGTLLPGDRIPSVRACSRQMGVSLTTVKEAYRRLEDAGRIEARPQSGYYVRHLPVVPARSGFRRPSEPSPSRPAPEPTPVSVGALGLSILRDATAPGLVPLGAAVPSRELMPLGKIARALNRVSRDAANERALSSYDVPPGCFSLREQVARRLMLAGCSVSPDEVITTAGAQEAIHLCLRATCQPGDTVAIESPVFYGILQAIESLGLRVLEVPTDPRTGISLSALENVLDEAKRSRVRIGACLVVASHNNPLGSCLPDTSKARLVALLQERDIPLIEDDVYGDLGHDRGRPKTCKAWDHAGNVLLCSSFSKTLSPALRVGYVVPGRFRERIQHLQMVTTLGGSALTQLAVAELLRNGGYEHHLRRVRRAYKQQTALMSEAVGHWFPDGTRVSRPSGGYVLWVELPPRGSRWASGGTSGVMALYRDALAAGISFAPGFLFSARGDAYGNCLRLNAAHWSPDVERAVQTLGRLTAR